MKKIPVKTLYLLLVIGIGLVGIGIGSTYAIFTASAEINDPITLNSSLEHTSDIIETIEVEVPAGETISTTLNVTNDSGTTLNYVIWYLDEDYDIQLGTESGTPSGSVTSGSNKSIGIKIKNYENENVTVILGISSNSNSIVLGNGMTAVPNGPLTNLDVTLVEHINNLYTNANKTTVTNNDIVYNYATSVSLMNDRLGGTTNDYNGGNIRYYGANPNNYIDIGDVYTEETVIDNFEKNSMILSSIGVSESNACSAFFDCSTNYEVIGQLMGLTFTDEASCNSGLQNYYHMTSVNEMCGTTTKAAGDPKLYRIIGLFKDVEMEDGTKQDLIKVIREDSIGDLAWDLKGTNESNATFDNNWHNATLQTILNGAYYSAGSTSHSYYDMFSGSYVVGNTIDFLKSGLNSSVQNKIASVVWNLGGWNSSEIYSNQFYEYERGDTKCTDCTYETEWPGKVALMYPSDYGYATDFSSCSNMLYNYYDESDCYANDWLFSLSNGNTIEWLLTPNSGSSDSAWFVGRGVFYYGGAFDGIGARPVFYLDSELGIESGNGSKSTPFVIR